MRTSIVALAFVGLISVGGIASAKGCIKGAAVVRRAHKIEPASVAELDAIAHAMPERLQLAVLLGGWLALRRYRFTAFTRVATA